MKRARLFLVAALLLLPTSRFLGAAPPEEKHSEDKGTKATSKPRGDSISKDTLAGRELNRTGGSAGAVIGGMNRGVYGRTAGSSSGSAKAGSRKAAKSSRTADSQKEKKSDGSKKQ